MSIKVKKVKAPIRRKKVGQKQKQRQSVNVNVNIDQSKRTSGTKRTPIIREDVKPKILSLPTFYSQPYTQPNLIPTLNNNIIKDEVLRKQQQVKLGDFNNNVSNLKNIPNKEVESVIDNLVSDNPTTNKQEIFDWNLGVEQKLKTTPMNITFLKEEEKSDNALGNLVYKEKKSQEEKLVEEAFDENLEQEQEEDETAEPVKAKRNKTYSNMTKDELKEFYYQLVDELKIENPLNGMEIKGLTIDEFRNNYIKPIYDKKKEEQKEIQKQINLIEKNIIKYEKEKEQARNKKKSKSYTYEQMNKKISELQYLINEQSNELNKYKVKQNNLQFIEES